MNKTPHTWDCNVCTFSNSFKAFKCIMCDIRKGSSTRKTPINPEMNGQEVGREEEQIKEQAIKYFKTKVKEKPKDDNSFTIISERNDSQKRCVSCVQLKDKSFCSVCKKGFNHSKSLKDHEVLHSRHLFVCNFNGCQKRFKTPNDLRTHEFRRHEKNENKIQRNASNCSRVIDINYGFESEEESNSGYVCIEDIVWKPFKCHFDCEQRFLRLDLLRDHLNRHRILKPRTD